MVRIETEGQNRRQKGVEEVILFELKGWEFTLSFLNTYFFLRSQHSVHQEQVLMTVFR